MNGLTALSAGLPADFAMWATFAVIAATIVAYTLERWSIEAISLAAIVAYLLLFAALPVENRAGMTPTLIISGFANPALVTVLALIMVGQALFNTDALDAPSRFLAGAGSGRTATIAIILITAGVTSAFLNNTPVVLMFIPIVTAIAAQRNFDGAKALMPLSFIGILGGMTTLIGSSTNLLAAGVAEDAGIHIGFFDFTVPGLILAGVGAIYVVFVMPVFLRGRASMTDEIKSVSGRQFIAQIEISDGHPLEGVKSRSGLFPELADMTVRMVMRKDSPLLPPFEAVTLAPGDIVIVAATRQALATALATGSASVPVDEEDDEEAREAPIEANFTLAEAVVATGSRYVGRTIQLSGIRSALGVVVMGVQRKSRMQRKSLADIRLEPGDTLLVGGLPEDVGRLRASRDLILLEWSAAIVPARRYAPRALVIFAAIVAAAATGVVPIVVAALAGALAMIAAGCINVRQAARAFDGRIFMLVGASLASAIALQKTGGAMAIATFVVEAFAGQSTAMLLSAFFLATALITNILSNNATAVLFTPIAIGIAGGIGVPPEPFVIAVIFAANCSFATPVGYQTNLLVLGPGHYRFSDFLLAGLPLVLIIWLAYSFVGPWYYGL